MGDVVSTPRRQSLHTAGIVAGAALTLNVAFYAMSSVYFSDKPHQPADINAVRGAFALVSFIIALASYAAGLAPRMIGHGLAVVIGIASLIGGIAGLVSNLPVVMALTLVVSGVLLPVLALSSFKHSRSAWAFLISMLAVLATVTFFGAPKIRHVMHIGLWHALVIPGLMVVAVIALTMVRSEYKDRV